MRPAKIIQEFWRADDGSRRFRVYREGEKKSAKEFTSPWLAFDYVQKLYASEARRGGIAA